MPNSASDSPSARDHFNQTDLSTDDIVYTMLKLPATDIAEAASFITRINEPFCALIADRHEVSLVVPLFAWETGIKPLSEAHQTGRFRLITFESVLEFDVVGFMAIVASELAEAGVSVLPLAAFSRDHILVAEADFKNAWDTLHAAQKA